jgi:putative colanic acid biosynthesis acetyltransferase WcaF
MIDVLVTTHNEEMNLPYCLAALRGWTRKVFVVDSGSTDGTMDIARGAGAEFVHQDWLGYAGQKNWALEHLPFEAPWILILDADEVITAPLRDRLVEIANRPIEQVKENGFFINRLSYFMDQPIHHCGYYPSWNLRFFKRGLGRYEDRAVHEHIIIDDPIGRIPTPMDHYDRRGLEHFFAKHNRYSTLEAAQLFAEIVRPDEFKIQPNITAETRRRRWLKRHITHSVPLPGLWRFLYMFVLRRGILDGRMGFEFCRFIASYDAMVALKLRGLLRQYKRSGAEGVIGPLKGSALATAEGALRATKAPAAAPLFSPLTGEGVVQTQPEASPWTFAEKVARAIWMVLGKPIFRVSFHNWYGFRAWLLRLFGAQVGKGVAIRPSVNVEIPWMIEVDDDATIGDHAILYSLGKIHIGKRAIISQYAHLCAGTHDYTDHSFRLIRSPIDVGDDVWIGADAFIGPNVVVGRLSVVGARSSVYKNVPEQKVCVGNPAKPIKDRILR